MSFMIFSSFIQTDSEKVTLSNVYTWRLKLIKLKISLWQSNCYAYNYYYCHYCYVWALIVLVLLEFHFKSFIVLVLSVSVCVSTKVDVFLREWGDKMLSLCQLSVFDYYLNIKAFVSVWTSLEGCLYRLLRSRVWDNFRRSLCLRLWWLTVLLRSETVNSKSVFVTFGA